MCIKFSVKVLRSVCLPAGAVEYAELGGDQTDIGPYRPGARHIQDLADPSGK